MSHIAEIMADLAAELEAERNPVADRIRAGLRKADRMTKLRIELAGAARHLGEAMRDITRGYLDSAKVYHDLASSNLRMAAYYAREDES